MKNPLVSEQLKKSISNLEDWKWEGEIPTPDDSNIVYRFYQLHDISINQMELHDIRFLINQNSGLKYLVPIAMELLEDNIFIETEYYAGDLLCSLFCINNDSNYWSEHIEQYTKLCKLYEQQKSSLGKLDLLEDEIVKIKKEYNIFSNKNFLEIQ